MDYVKIWEKWMREKKVLTSRYEDLLNNYDAESRRLVDFLNLRFEDPPVLKVLEDYRPSDAQGQQGLHFYKGKIGRFRQEYTSIQQEQMLQRIGGVLIRMGYEP